MSDPRPPTFLIVTESFEKGLRKVELASILARGVRAEVPGLSSDQVVQYPIVDGGDGTLDVIVTNLLGSFLEVEATNAYGKQLVVPLGFTGENGILALIRADSIAGREIDATTDGGVWGTSFGVGELIRDALDEGAFSIVIGLKEPLAPDAGLGLAAALGVRFLDKDGNAIELNSPRSDLFELVDRIDLSQRPFELLTSRFYAARAAARPNVPALPNPTRAANLERLNAMLLRDCGKEVDLSSVDIGGSAIEFGLQAFFNTEIRDGSALMLEISGVDRMLSERASPLLILAVESSHDLIGEETSVAMTKILGIAGGANVPTAILLSEPADERALSRLSELLPSVVGVYALPDAPLFQAPLASTASEDEARRDQRLRIEKLIPAICSALISSNKRTFDGVRANGVASGGRTGQKKSASKA